MPAYRIYTLRDDGHIDGPAAIIECPDDEAAVQEVRRALVERAIGLGSSV
jgi:hypothetical protein